MKIVRFMDSAGAVHWGVAADERLLRADVLNGSPLDGGTPTGEIVDIARLLAPIVPVNVLCIGLNYRRHAVESNMAIPERPLLFLKPTSSVIGPGDPIVLPAQSSEVDYECELAVVIGKTARNVSEADALDFVLGYTIANDVSARDWQLRLDKQWARGKGFDTFCPLGSVLVTSDEIPDPQTLAISTVIGGETLQQSSTSDMIFSVREIISYLSHGMTLLPGTVILTGTPEGVGMGRTPNRWLAPGESVSITVERICTLTNPIVAEAEA